MLHKTGRRGQQGLHARELVPHTSAWSGLLESDRYFACLDWPWWTMGEMTDGQEGQDKDMASRCNHDDESTLTCPSLIRPLVDG